MTDAERIAELEAKLDGVTLTMREGPAARIKDLEAKLEEARKSSLPALREKVIEAARLCIDDCGCRLDHEGYCQNHGLNKPCEQAELKIALTALDAAEAKERGV